jgi:hypothetical protein
MVNDLLNIHHGILIIFFVTILHNLRPHVLTESALRGEAERRASGALAADGCGWAGSVCIVYIYIDIILYF